jgi:hypothetical protein
MIEVENKIPSQLDLPYCRLMSTIEAKSFLEPSPLPHRRGSFTTLSNRNFVDDD